MPVSNQLKNQHLFWRAGFGPMVEQWKQLPLTTPAKYYEALVKSSKKKPEYFRVAENAFDGLLKGIDNFSKVERISKEQRQALLKKSREEIRNLNLEWIDEMVNSDQQLREKAAFLWHGHFACRNLNVLYQQQLINTIRENALGNFGDLLRAVSKSAAMLAFLNNQQNRKQHPNENFAREVMELFTIGRGNYTENDVKEAARAFTGWSFKLDGSFQPRPFQHDSGAKTFLGKTGNFDGDDILNILLEQKQTARFITQKIYRFYVNENELEEEKIDWLSGRFYQRQYNIQQLLDDIFTSDWFYTKKNIGSKIKSPVELLTGARRTLPVEFQNKEIQLLFQRILGQVLFYPPNVAGWPGGQTWIDSSSLMFRLRFPQLVAGGEVFNLRPKDMDDGGFEKDMMNMQTLTREKGQFRRMQTAVANIKWDAALKMMESTPKDRLMETMMRLLWQSPSPQIPKELVEGFIDKSSREAFIKTSLVQLMSTPEYQMC